NGYITKIFINENNSLRSRGTKEVTKKMKIANKISIAMLVLMVLSLQFAAAYLDISTVRVNGDLAEDGDDLYVERSDTLKIRVTVEAGDEDVNNAQIQAFVAGYRYAHVERDLVTDYTRTF